tara:strand:- start:28 stop:255 length:228 start_codon:yes stop_codon:yes gene_type:complete
MGMMHDLRYFLEKRGFEVCSRLAERLGMKAKHVRIFFIYLSFFSLGVGFALYLVFAFWLKMKDFLFAKRSSVFDL